MEIKLGPDQRRLVRALLTLQGLCEAPLAHVRASPDRALSGRARERAGEWRERGLARVSHKALPTCLTGPENACLEYFHLPIEGRFQSIANTAWAARGVHRRGDEEAAARKHLVLEEREPPLEQRAQAASGVIAAIPHNLGLENVPTMFDDRRWSSSFEAKCSSPKIAAQLNGGEIVKTVVVPGRLVNFVVR